MSQMIFNKEKLLSALEAMRPKLQKIDDKELAAHKKIEDKFFQAWSDSLATASKWDYAEAKKHHFALPEIRGEKFGWGRGPSCPRSLVKSLDEHLAIVSKSAAQRYTITPRGVHQALWEILTADIAKATDLC